MDYSFETDRLTVTHWRADLADPEARRALELTLPGILAPETTAFLPPHMQLGAAAEAATWIDARAAESDVCLVKTHDDMLLGLLILFVADEDERMVVRIGYLLDQAQWGKGYASELLAGLVDWCRGQVQSGGKPMELIGGVEADNGASIRVLEKAGFALEGDTSTDTNRYYHLQVE
ncbi:GNAT family N-acetyltransferase [Kordiimonas lacus]|uniref:Protein N-acetyltransferase, RimJ/RimL family n=1 Tax=Kordiimonas lacus TaxID=637679 RepID=A0A1G6ZZ65_9PROT|nr:GNAT family N-acetyltransferase [Kordiimonas lacus]SDE07974.1 Protein N-acetyltransferase, RimJ/RimL family [Kordiimonas lacus]